MNKIVLQILRLVALLGATIVNLWIFPILFIYGAHFIDELFNGDGQAFGFDAIQNLMFFGMTLSVASVIIAFFRSFTGGVLIILSSLLLIVFDFAEEMRRPDWPLYLLILAGLLLLYYVYVKRILRKTNDTNNPEK